MIGEGLGFLGTDCLSPDTSTFNACHETAARTTPPGYGGRWVTDGDDSNLRMAMSPRAAKRVSGVYASGPHDCPASPPVHTAGPPSQPPRSPATLYAPAFVLSHGSGLGPSSSGAHAVAPAAVAQAAPQVSAQCTSHFSGYTPPARSWKSVTASLPSSAGSPSARALFLQQLAGPREPPAGVALSPAAAAMQRSQQRGLRSGQGSPQSSGKLPCPPSSWRHSRALAGLEQVQEATEALWGEEVTSSVGNSASGGWHAGPHGGARRALSQLPEDPDAYAARELYGDSLGSVDAGAGSHNASLHRAAGALEAHSGMGWGRVEVAEDDIVVRGGCTGGRSRSGSQAEGPIAARRLPAPGGVGSRSRQQRGPRVADAMRPGPSHPLFLNAPMNEWEAPEAVAAVTQAAEAANSATQAGRRNLVLGRRSLRGLKAVVAPDSPPAAPALPSHSRTSVPIPAPESAHGTAAEWVQHLPASPFAQDGRQTGAVWLLGQGRALDASAGMLLPGGDRGGSPQPQRAQTFLVRPQDGDSGGCPSNECEQQFPPALGSRQAADHRSAMATSRSEPYLAGLRQQELYNDVSQEEHAQPLGAPLLLGTTGARAVPDGVQRSGVQPPTVDDCSLVRPATACVPEDGELSGRMPAWDGRDVDPSEMGDELNAAPPFAPVATVSPVADSSCNGIGTGNIPGKITYLGTDPWLPDDSEGISSISVRDIGGRAQTSLGQNTDSVGLGASSSGCLATTGFANTEGRTRDAALGMLHTQKACGGSGCESSAAPSLASSLDCSKPVGATLCGALQQEPPSTSAELVLDCRLRPVRIAGRPMDSESSSSSAAGFAAQPAARSPLDIDSASLTLAPTVTSNVAREPGAAGSAAGCLLTTEAGFGSPLPSLDMLSGSSTWARSSPGSSAATPMHAASAAPAASNGIAGGGPVSSSLRRGSNLRPAGFNMRPSSQCNEGDIVLTMSLGCIAPSLEVSPNPERADCGVDIRQSANAQNCDSEGVLEPLPGRPNSSADDLAAGSTAEVQETDVMAPLPLRRAAQFNHACTGLAADDANAMAATALMLRSVSGISGDSATEGALPEEIAGTDERAGTQSPPPPSPGPSQLQHLQWPTQHNELATAVDSALETPMTQTKDRRWQHAVLPTTVPRRVAVGERDGDGGDVTSADAGATAGLFGPSVCCSAVTPSDILASPTYGEPGDSASHAAVSCSDRTSAFSLRSLMSLTDRASLNSSIGHAASSVAAYVSASASGGERSTNPLFGLSRTELERPLLHMTQSQRSARTSTGTSGDGRSGMAGGLEAGGKAGRGTEKPRSRSLIVRGQPVLSPPPSPAEE